MRHGMLALLICPLLPFRIFAGSFDFDLLWRAHALRAYEKADSLSKIKGKAGSSSKVRYERTIYLAYANIIQPEASSILRKDTENFMVYHVVFGLGAGNVDLAYWYEKSTAEFSFMRVDRLPAGWSALPGYMRGESTEVLWLMDQDNKEPILVFDLTNPFNWSVHP